MNVTMRFIAVVVLVSTVLLPAPAMLAADSIPVIEVLSNRADLVSRGDALMEVVLPPDVDAAGLSVRLGDRDVSSAFALRGDGRLIGLVEGLDVGENELTAVLPDGRGARLTITNHRIGGPVFAGPQVQPWVCDTAQYGLGQATDEQCNTAPRFDFRYKSAVTGAFEPYDPDDPPGDLAMTTTDNGVTVPYIVRVEIGVMDRGGYHIGVLYDPEQPWDPWAPQPGFNGKVFVRFGGGGSTKHGQGSADGIGGTETSVFHDLALSRGFAVMNSSLNSTENGYNDVVSAEALMMLKEHFVENYGAIRYTMGHGCSGGSLQQHAIASNYPGLLDGLIPVCSLPDLWTGVQSFEDCHLMQRVFDEVSPHLWANQQQQAFAAGFPTVSMCRLASSTARTFFDPDAATGCVSGNFEFELEQLDRPEWVYDPDTNPDGTRCTIQDYQVAVWGERPPEVWTEPEQRLGRGFANRPYDNVGVQYGLEALRTGRILPEQFVDLNLNVGGVDIDWNHQPERSTGDPMAIDIAYRTGHVVDPVSLGRVPIVDVRALGYAEFHPNVYSYVTRARLDAVNGHHDNHVILTEPGPLSLGEASRTVGFDLLDRWLSAVEADTRDIPLEDKVVTNKPADAVDTCLAAGEPIAEGATCETLFPPFSNTRLTAGAPPADDVMKCQLRRLDRSDDYGLVPFTDEQWARLQAAFPEGVCDYTKPGIGEQPSIAWLDYSDGPGGTPLGPPPRSTPIDGLWAGKLRGGW